MTPAAVAALQRTAGNAAVSRLISERRAMAYLARDTRVGVYNPATKDLDPRSNQFGKAFEKLQAQPRFHGAQVGSLKEEGGDPYLDLTIPPPIGATVTVTIVLAQAQANAAPSSVVLTQAGNAAWTATITVGMRTRVDDLAYVLGHEIDEVTQRVAGGGAGGAGIYDPNAANAAQVSAQDPASAAELINQLLDLQKLQKKRPVATAQELQHRRDTIGRLVTAMGLDQPANTAAKTAILRSVYMQLPKEDRDRYEDMKPNETLLEQILEESRQAGSGAAPNTNPLRSDAALLGHLRYSDLSDDFARSGLSGGHDDAAMQTFLQLNPRLGIVVVPQANPVAIPGGGQFIVYEQYQWQFPGGQPVPAPNAANYPQLGQATPQGWVKAAPRKTVATNFDNFLASAETAFLAWQQQKQTEGYFNAQQAKLPHTIVDGNQKYEMYVESAPGTPPKITIHTLYPVFT